MDTTIFKIHAKTELSLYPTILTSSLDIILINDIIDDSAESVPCVAL